jgi:hypothetical protein
VLCWFTLITKLQSASMNYFNECISDERIIRIPGLLISLANASDIKHGIRAELYLQALLTLVDLFCFPFLILQFTIFFWRVPSTIKKWREVHPHPPPHSLSKPTSLGNQICLIGHVKFNCSTRMVTSRSS